MKEETDFQDVLDVFEHVLETNRSIDVAESEFKRQIYEDDALHRRYREWCRMEGVTEKTGFIDYCQERYDQEESLWEALSDEEDFS